MQYLHRNGHDNKYLIFYFLKQKVVTWSLKYNNYICKPEKHCGKVLPPDVNCGGVIMQSNQ